MNHSSSAIRRAARHAPALLIFPVLALWSTFPLALHLASSIPGTGPGDNVSYLWNLWWFRYAVEHEAATLFDTPMVFAPFGTQLVLHTHTTLQSLLAYVVLPAASLPTAHNVVLLAGLVANGLLTYALAFYLVREVLPSLAAGVLFAGSAYVQIHLFGHFNLTHAWVIPLFAMALSVFARRPSHARAALLAASAAAVTYTDYYFTIYCLGLTVLWVICRSRSLHAEPSARRYERTSALFLVLMLVDAALIAAILATGGAAFDLGGHRVSLQTIRNPLTVFWMLLAGWAISSRPLRVTIRRGSPSGRLPSVARWGSALALYGLLISPILYGTVRLVMSGDYVTQRVLWRSGPPGVDVATLILGPPRHLATGGWTEAAYSHLGIGAEQVACIGLVPPVILLLFAGWRRLAEVRVWVVTGVTFFVLSLGPFLRAGGFDTALLLPWAALRYVPVLSNARIPGRAFIMVHLSIAILTAFALAGKERSKRVAYALAILLLLEALPAPVPLYPLPPPDAVDIELAVVNGAGIVAELPTGLRDGFGELGSFDHRALVHQISHGRPLVGGFVARLSDNVRDKYVESPFLSTLLSVSDPVAEPKSLPPDAAAQASLFGIRYLVINRDRLPDTGPLTRAAVEGAGFRFVRAAGQRELYVARGKE